jgi:RNA recognition motif-containing protein
VRRRQRYRVMSNIGTEIFVANLSERINEEDLRKFFEKYAGVHNVEIIRDRVTNRSKCRAFVKVDSEESAYTAITALSNSELDGKSVILTIALERGFYEY